MLSKVLKGDEARKIQTLAFADMFVPAGPVGRQHSPDSVIGVESHAILLEKIRTLELGMAAAQRDAFDSGRQKGEQASLAALDPVLGRLNASIAEIITMRPELRRRAEQDAVSLSLKIAARVLHRELSSDSNALNALARVVFDRMARSESWKLTVHPQFADAIRSALPAGSIEKVRIEADPSCLPGTVIARSADGAIDASIDNQLDEIGRGLTDRLAAK